MSRVSRTQRSTRVSSSSRSWSCWRPHSCPRWQPCCWCCGLPSRRRSGKGRGASADGADSVRHSSCPRSRRRWSCSWEPASSAVPSWSFGERLWGSSRNAFWRWACGRPRPAIPTGTSWRAFYQEVPPSRAGAARSRLRRDRQRAPSVGPEGLGLSVHRGGSNRSRRRAETPWPTWKPSAPITSGPWGSS